MVYKYKIRGASRPLFCIVLNRIEIEVPSQLSDRVKQIVLDPYRKLEAIKLYRGETGASLVGAKEAIEEFIAQNQEKWR